MRAPLFVAALVLPIIAGCQNSDLLAARWRTPYNQMGYATVMTFTRNGKIEYDVVFSGSNERDIGEEPTTKVRELLGGTVKAMSSGVWEVRADTLCIFATFNNRGFNACAPYNITEVRDQRILELGERGTQSITTFYEVR